MNSTNKKTPNSKRHHYVQQAYLKNFACNEKKTFIWMMDKWEKKIFEKPQKIRDCAQFWFFYPQELEEWLNNNIESNGINVIRKLLYHQDYDKLSDLEKKQLFEWIYVQYIRTPDFVNTVVDLFNEMLSLISQKKEFLLPDEILEVFQSNNPKIQLLKKYYYRIVKLIFNSIQKKTLYDYTWLDKEWILFKNRTVFPYFTSDNPVILWKAGDKVIQNKIVFEWLSNRENFLPQSFSFSLERGIMYFISLNPNTLLLLSEKNPFPASIIEQDKYSQIYNVNKMITAQSSRYIFSNENYFEHAFNTITEIPGCVKKINRIDTSRVKNESLDYEVFKIQNKDRLDDIIRHYDEIDDERKETFFDSDFIL